jgi:hypothetical protein
VRARARAGECGAAAEAEECGGGVSRRADENGTASDARGRRRLGRVARGGDRVRRGVLWDRSPSSPPLRAEAALRPRPLARRAGRAAVAAQVELNADLAGGVSFDEFIQVSQP